MGREADDRGWDGWMAPLAQFTLVCVYIYLSISISISIYPLPQEKHKSSIKESELTQRATREGRTNNTGS